MCPSLIRSVAYTVLFLTMLCQKIQGQNLVANPSFEDVNICAEFGQPCSPSAWFYLSRKFTTGYFPRYPSATGSRHLQIVAASQESVNRQYWETMLLCPLHAGDRYAVSMKIASPVNRTDLSKRPPNLRDIGLWFTGRFIFVDGDSILQPRSYLTFTDASTKDLKNGWFEIKKEFVATANSTILIVGNFARSANADLMDLRSPTTPTLDILIDDLSVVPVKGGICGGAGKLKEWLYAVTDRHSEKLSGDLVPGMADTLPDIAVKNPPEPGSGTETPKLSVPPVRTDTIIVHNIQFDFDKYLIENPDTLEQYRRLLTRPGIKRVQVVGFTDDAGSDAYNLDLSEKRAREVARLLSSMFGVDSALVEAEGRGISRKYPTKNLNRRVEIYIFH